MRNLGLRFDLKYSLRSIRKSWRSSLGVILTLAVGIGANTLVYSIVDSAILHPFPFPEPDRLVGIGSEWPRLSRDLGFFETLSPAEYRDIQTQTETLEKVVVWDMGFRSVTTGIDQPEVLLSGFWFNDVFPTLGLPPALGRGFSAEELARGDQVAILSHRYWLTRLGGDPAALGSTIRVEGIPYTLIGVMAPGGQILGSDLWIPIAASIEEFPRSRRNMEVMARIKPGFSIEEVNAELATISGRIEQEYGAEFEEYAGWRLQALNWTEVNVRAVRPAAIALLGAVAFVLLIVCANIGSLMLSRSASRRRELAIRVAIGANRARILRQLLTESLVLATIGGLVGIGVTLLGVSTLLPPLVARIPFVAIEIAVNSRVLLFTTTMTLLTGLVFGLIPALHATRAGVQSSLQADGGFAIGSVGRQRLQRVFVGAEVAVALVLLAQAGLLVNSFLKMQNVDVGLDTSNTLTMRLTLPRQRYPDAVSINGFFQDLVERVGGLSGVRRAGAGTQYAPLTFGRFSFAVEGDVYQSDDQLPTAYRTVVTEGYHEALGIPLSRGRTFTRVDTADSPRVAVINQAAADRFFADVEPVGKRFQSGGPDSPWIEIVGVVGSVSNRGPEREPQPEFFTNLRQLASATNQLFLIVQTETDPRAMLGPVQQVVTALDPDQSVYAVGTLDEAFDTITAPRRLGTLAILSLAAFALLLAASGIYAVVSFGVAERRREIGVRVALGATATAVRRMLVRQAMMPVAIGGLAGLGLAVAAGRAISGLLYGVSGSDPLTLAAVTLALIGLAATASYLPARKASRLDPTTALRNN